MAWVRMKELSSLGSVLSNEKEEQCPGVVGKDWCFLSDEKMFFVKPHCR